MTAKYKTCYVFTFIIAFNFHNNHGEIVLLLHFINEKVEAQRVFIICPGDTAITGSVRFEL